MNTHVLKQGFQDKAICTDISVLVQSITQTLPSMCETSPVCVLSKPFLEPVPREPAGGPQPESLLEARACCVGWEAGSFLVGLLRKTAEDE